MGFNVDNAIIMAAGCASRFAPLSFEKPKALFDVKGEVLLERQINQLKDVGIPKIYLIVGYKKEMFGYLRKKFGIEIIENKEYLERNNNSSIYAAKDILNNSYICSSDNYFSVNPFELEVDESYYAAIYAEGKTEEWCMHTDKDGYITDVQVGGENAWYMLGHAFWDENFTKKILKILLKEYNLPETADLFWENIFVNNISEFKMKLRKYDSNAIYEFDTLDELRIFDKTYIENTRSKIMKCLAKKHNCSEGQIVNVAALKGSKNDAIGFEYQIGQEKYKYIY